MSELGLLNGRISWSNIELGGTRWRVSAWGRNLTDEAEVDHAYALYERVHARGLRLNVLFKVPYCSELNPVEFVFNIVKMRIKQQVLLQQ